MRFAVPWVLAFLLLIPGGCWAISLYDVIQLSKAGYSDSRIIDLIKVTESRFQLDADNIITLKQAGVSEKVIQVVIEASEPAKSAEPASPQQELEKEPSESASSHQHSHEHNEPEVNPEPSSRLSTSPVTEQSRPPGPSQRSISPSGSFDFFLFEEAGAGHGGPHQHYAVSTNGVGIFVLRSEAGYKTVPERAKEIADLLNGVVKTPNGHFLAAGEPDPAVWYRAEQGQEPIRILGVTSGDVIAYQRRSLGGVSAVRLAAYWAALLNDYSQVFLFGRPPTELVSLHLGETLARIYSDLSSPPKEEPAEESADAVSAMKILDHLSADDKDHLIELAMRVPLEFQEKEVSQ